MRLRLELERRRSAQSGAFTLVELLVVLAVVALLAGILLPSVAKARTLSHTARCTSNLHQFGLAAQMYWDDHGGRAFSERTVRTNGGWKYWFGWLQDGAEGERAFDPAAGALWAYLPSRAVDTCPALNRCPARFKSKARGAAFGYAYNLLVGPRGAPGILPLQVARPSRLAIFTDGGQVNDFLSPASAEHPMLEEFYYFDTNALSATVHFRHGGRAQVASADGHVAAEGPREGSMDLRIPGEVVGRLPDGRVAP
ncbi:MAG: prepilin-type N-terminal cleavage/methylation domain-containing protein [Verrucomicrobiales bacterium]|nr:prepilin-type N-terminal cleavage/methylation domain-containing protein [Verrucomicrobiales bacterium]